MFSINKRIFSHTKILLTSIFCALLANVALIGSLSIFASPAHALVASADMGNFYPGAGYGAQILDTVLDVWENPDPNTKGVSSIALRISNDGRPFSCEIRRFSSSQITDTSICETIAQIGTFPAPQGSQNSEIILTFVHDRNTKNTVYNSQNMPNNVENSNTSPQNLNSTMSAQNIEKFIESNTNLTQNPASTTPQALQSPTTQPTNLPRIGSSLIAPASVPAPALQPMSTAQASPAIANSQNTTKIANKATPPAPAAAPRDLVSSAAAMQEYSQGIFNQARTLIRIRPLPQGTHKSIMRIDIAPNGILKDVSVQTSSGISEMDNEILRVLKDEVKYPPTPQNDQQSIWLTFTIQR